MPQIYTGNLVSQELPLKNDGFAPDT